MKLISLKSYRNGYTGFVEEKERYVFFNFSRKGKFKNLLEYSKADYTSYDHFLSVISKFIPRKSFFKKPIPFESMTIAELDRIYKEVL
ncbi:hypothetical protein QUF72_12380 [Desulfobacterales bacterium HSG2]|nr:hypothetical protein [Desulfobacterales bacterium HSG2]